VPAPAAYRDLVRKVAALATAAGLSAAISAWAAPAASAQLDARAARVVSAFVRRSYPTVPVGHVTCPAARRATLPDRFTCTVQLPGGFLVVEARRSSARGSVALSSPQAVVAKARLEEFVIAQASLPAAADCGPAPWLALRPGQKVVCSAKLADGTTRQVELTVRNVEGDMTVTAVS
jgi:hypothetical protein